MIVIYSPTTKSRMQIDGVVRNGSCLWYLIGIGMGFDTCCLLINSNDESEAMDVYADSRYGHLTEINQSDLNDYLNPERKKAADLMESIKDSANDAIDELESNSEYLPFDFDSIIKDIRDWNDEAEPIEWDNELYNGINYIGNEGKPHQLDEVRIFECIPRSQIKWFHKKIDLMFDSNRNQQF